jgi:hypothetical protein
MESVLRKLGGHPIKPAALYKELETGCLRAVPDNEEAANYFLDFFSKSDEWQLAKGEQTREAFEEYYQWHLSGSVWEKYFDSFEALPFEQTWGSEPKIQQPAQKLDLSQAGPVSNTQLAKHLISDVLREPQKLNTFFEARLTRDLIYKQATSSTGGMYFNESSAAFDGVNRRQPFDYNIAYDQMSGLCNRRNQWEQKRIETIKQRQQS